MPRMDATELLELAAAYVRAQDAADIAASLGVPAQPDPRDIAARFGAGLEQLVADAVRRAVQVPQP